MMHINMDIMFIKAVNKIIFQIVFYMLFNIVMGSFYRLNQSKIGTKL